MGEGREESRYYHINIWEKEGKNRGIITWEKEGKNRGIITWEKEGKNRGINTWEKEGKNRGINTWEKEGKNRGIIILTHCTPLLYDLLLSNACEGPRPLSLAHMAATGFRVLQKYGCIRPLSGVKGY